MKPSKPKEPTKFEYELEQYKTELKQFLTSDDSTNPRVKELTRYIRNLENIIKRLKR